MKTMRKRRVVTLLPAVVLGSLACSGPLGVSVMAVDVTGPVTVSVTAPVVFSITATNAGDERVAWGMGSSSCQFGLVVVGDALERHDIAIRGCTADLVEHALGPGETRTEEISWAAQIIDGDELVDLEPGEYRVIATLGEDYESRPLRVTVVVE